MSVYTPGEARIRIDYCNAAIKRSQPDGTFWSMEDADAAFGRWLAAHDAEVSARALNDAADAINRDFQNLPSWDASWKAGERDQSWMNASTRTTIDTIDWLHARASSVLAAAGVTQPEPEYEYRCKLDSIRPDDFHEWVEVDEAHQCPGTKERRVIKAGDWEPVPNQQDGSDE